MYNWSIPSALKAWLDRLLLQPNVWQTEKVAAGRPAVNPDGERRSYGPGRLARGLVADSSSRRPAPDLTPPG